MEKYEEIELEVIVFDAEDVITTSITPSQNELPVQEFKTVEDFV